MQPFSVLDVSTEKPADAIQRRFDEFHGNHPEIYAKVAARALALKRAGHPWYSIDAILHWLRVEMDLTHFEGEGGYKLNNDFTSRYSRLLMENNEELVGFFRTRALQRRRTVN